MSSFCPACGNSMEGADQFCRVCGRQIGAGGAPGIATVPTAPTGPVGNSGKAIASLVFGIFFLFFPFSIVAIILGHLALSEIRKSAGRLQGHGMAVAGLVLGYGGVVFIPVILIIAAIAIPNLLRARMAANESSAVASVRTITTAESSYATTHQDEGFTCSLPDLGAMIPASLAQGSRSGYKFELTDCSSDTGSGANAHYHVLAYPQNPNQTGIRAFCSDESGVIKVDAGGSVHTCMESGGPLQ